MVDRPDQTAPMPEDSPVTQNVFAAGAYQGPVPDIALVDQSSAMVAKWLAEAAVSEGHKARKAKWDRLARMLRADSASRLKEITEIALAPNNSYQAARALSTLDPQQNKDLPRSLQFGAFLGATLGQAMPAPSIPALRSLLRKSLGFYLTPFRVGVLRSRCVELQAQGTPATVKLLVPAPATARQREQLIDDWMRLIRQVDVTEVLLNPADLVPASASWDLDAAVADASDLLRPVLLEAVADNTTILFDANSARDFELNRLIFAKLAPEAAFMTMNIGFTLPAQLINAASLLKGFAAWAQERVELGGAPIRVRLSRAASFRSDAVQAAALGLPAASFSDPDAAAANYLRCLNQALTASSARVMRVISASNDPFDTAFALALAEERKLNKRLTIEHESGVNPALNQVMIPDALAQGARVHLTLNLFRPDGLDQAILFELPALLALPSSAPALVAERQPLSDTIADGSSSETPEAAEAPETAGPPDPQLPGEANFLYAVEYAFNGQLPAENPRAKHFERKDTEITRAKAPESVAGEGEENLTRAVISIAHQQHGSIASLHETGQLPVIGEFFAGHEFVETAIFASHQLAAVKRQNTDEATLLGHAFSDALLASERERFRRLLAEVAVGGVAELPLLGDAAPELSRSAREAWLALPRAERGELMRAVARLMSLRRDALVKAVMHDSGALFVQAERELASAVAFADRYAGGVGEFAELSGVSFEPLPLLGLELDPAQPLSSLSAMVFAALGAGSPTVVLNADAAPVTVRILQQIFADAQLPLALLAAPLVSLSPVEFAGLFPEAELLWSLKPVSGVVLDARAPGDSAASDSAAIAEAEAEADVEAEAELEAEIEIAPGVELSIDIPLDFSTETEAEPATEAADEAPVELFDPDLAIAQTQHPQNAAIIMPSANLRDAAHALVLSAFGASGQHSNRIALAIVVGSTSRNTEFAEALMAEVRALKPGSNTEAATTITALPAPLSDAARYALTEIGDGERWALEPELVAEHPGSELWSPGVRVAVTPDSRAYQEAAAVPVLGVMHARTLQQALKLQNGLQQASCAAIFTRDTIDAGQWLQNANAPALFLNTATVPEGILLEPFALSRPVNFAPALRAGDPDVGLHLGRWRVEPQAEQSSTLHLRGLDSKIVDIIETAQASLYFDDFEWLRQGALSDAFWWARSYGQINEYALLGAARKLLRYRPRPQVFIRAGAETELREVLRVLLAAVRSGSEIVLSAPEDPFHSDLREVLESYRVSIRVQSLAELADDLPEMAALRLIGPDALAETTQLRQIAPGAEVFLNNQPVTGSGRLELLPFLWAQTISLPLYQEGTVENWSWQLI